MKKKLIGLTEAQCEWLKENCEPRRESEIVRRALDMYIEHVSYLITTHKHNLEEEN